MGPSSRRLFLSSESECANLDSCLCHRLPTSAGDGQCWQLCHSGADQPNTHVPLQKGIMFADFVDFTDLSALLTLPRSAFRSHPNSSSRLQTWSTGTTSTRPMPSLLLVPPMTR
jgi:hypothetical protein